MIRTLPITLIALLITFALANEPPDAEDIMWLFASDNDAVLTECPAAILAGFPDIHCATLFGTDSLIRSKAELWVLRYGDVAWWGPWQTSVVMSDEWTYRFFAVDDQYPFHLTTYERAPFDSLVFIGPLGSKDD